MTMPTPMTDAALMRRRAWLRESLDITLACGAPQGCDAATAAAGSARLSRIDSWTDELRQLDRLAQERGLLAWQRAETQNE